MEWILLFLAAMGCGALVVYYIIKPRLVRTQEEDREIARKNEELEDKLVELQYNYRQLREKKEELVAQIYETESYLTMVRNQADESAQVIYDKSLSLAQEKFAQAAEEERLKYIAAIDSYKAELAQTMHDGTAAYLESVAESTLKCKELEEKFQELQSTTNAAVAAAKRAEEIKQESNYYKLQLSELDIEEIHMLKNIAPYLRDKEPLNKVIWKVYYEKPTSDLIGRVVGTGVKTGIYKITNLDNSMCYIGQAVNIAERWKQHIKRGLGAETPTRNKLYPAMIAYGVENFSFEIIEECPRDQLDNREDYWQDYFKAKEFGYSIK